MIRSLSLYAAASLALIAATGALLGLACPDTASRHAVLVSAVIALVVQLFAFAAVKLAAGTNMLAGWGMGMLLRFVVLVAYGFVGARALALPMAPALISLVAFFFLTSLLEPVLLKT
jgi:hypothetical protein